MTNQTYTSFVEELEQVIAKQGWNLAKQVNSSWCSFKPRKRRNVAFGIMIGAGNTLYIYVKRVHAEAELFPIKAANYDKDHDQDEFLLEPGITQVESFLPLLKLAYSRC
ncbi:MAG: hypothetical protein IPK17_19415 [Chloroflexi bacterium]|uniref:hypothetical protein n=1 Tax=Candidatus Flexifilum breve TaxID=3140694 RepID=UPI0031363F70|nr:hypothetical protein [Chloroflexota bacterium]